MEEQLVPPQPPPPHTLLELPGHLIAETLSFLPLKDILSMSSVSRLTHKSITELEVLWRDKTLQRAGHVFEECGKSWLRSLQKIRHTYISHDKTCFKCRRYPIDGPLYSCLSCYGVDWVMCSQCCESSSDWHPADHVLVKWGQKALHHRKSAQPSQPSRPSTASRSKVHFMYCPLRWRYERCRVLPENALTTQRLICSSCGCPPESTILRCLTCPGHPWLCPGCSLRGVSPDELPETAAGRFNLSSLMAAEAVDCNDPAMGMDAAGASKEHSPLTHYMIAQNPSMVTIDPTRQQHRALCDGCGEMVMGVRYRCAVCFDYDYCATCEAIYQQQGVTTPLPTSAPSMRKHKCTHPMMVLPTTTHRQLINRSGRGCYSYLFDDEDSETSSSDSDGSPSFAWHSILTNNGTLLDAVNNAVNDDESDDTSSE